MKKVLNASLLTAEIAALCMLLLLYFLNSSYPWLLLVLLAEAAAGFFALRPLARRLSGKGAGKTPLLLALVGATLVLAALIAFSLIALRQLL